MKPMFFNADTREITDVMPATREFAASNTGCASLAYSSRSFAGGKLEGQHLEEFSSILGGFRGLAKDVSDEGPSVVTPEKIVEVQSVAPHKEILEEPCREPSVDSPENSVEEASLVSLKNIVEEPSVDSPENSV